MRLFEAPGFIGCFNRKICCCNREVDKASFEQAQEHTQNFTHTAHTGTHAQFSLNEFPNQLQVGYLYYEPLDAFQFHQNSS
jgi:hypothetical protein